MAVRNEGASIDTALDAVDRQVLDDSVVVRDIVVAVAPSTDDTAERLRRRAAQNPRLVVVDNPDGWVSPGLNAAIARSAGDVLVRVDGHCVLPPTYIATAVATLGSTGAAVVGGVQRAVGTGEFQQAVAAAMSSPLGVGDARFHYGGEAGPTDTVFLGVFRRDAVVAAGGFNESLKRNQDYELNWRIRNGGGVVWFTPELSVDYAPRATPRALARQYWDYGQWKLVMLSENPRSLKPRQVAAPLMVCGVAGASLLAGVTGRRWPLVAPAGYVLGIGAGGLHASRGQRPSVRSRVPLALATMHWSWGTGFLTAALSRLIGRRRT